MRKIGKKKMYASHLNCGLILENNIVAHKISSPELPETTKKPKFSGSDRRYCKIETQNLFCASKELQNKLENNFLGFLNQSFGCQAKKMFLIVRTRVVALMYFGPGKNKKFSLPP
jgi:hypothetical protein